jgi:hypothetical protein
LKQRSVPLARPEAPVRLICRAEAEEDLDRTAAALEAQFGICFETLAVFSGDTLRYLHAPGADIASEPRINIVAEHQPIITRLVDHLTDLANAPLLNHHDRLAYLETLLAIYSRLGLDAGSTSAETTLAIGIEREGRILAEKLECLPSSRSLRPQAKRVHYRDGLAVGITGIGEPEGFRNAVIIDGAIASGATLITLLEHLRQFIPHFSIYSAHATTEGLSAILRYAHSVALDVEVIVGHATTGLNDHYYAVLAEDPARVVVGDLGDTISPVAKT